MNIEELELGSTVEDNITGLVGTAVGVTKWLNGCTRVIIQPKVLKDGVPVDAHSTDIQQVRLVKAAPQHAETKKGGPMPTPTATSKHNR